MRYEDSGISDADTLLDSFFDKIKKTNQTLPYHKPGATLLSLGQYANVIRVTSRKSIAITTDGVGSKILVARDLKRWNTIGYDCVAMNVNDLLCVGAKPYSMVDYIAVDRIDSEVIEEIGIGLCAAAKEAGISISGGEISQVPDIVTGIDLAATAIGAVNTRDVLKYTGGSVVNSAIIGLRSSGIHSNGLTLARKVLQESTEELLTPTRIYVKSILRLLSSGCKVTGLAHITGGGFTNLLRLFNNVSYRIDNLPSSLPVFDTIQELGNVSNEEMYRVFNMGIGMMVMVAHSDVDAAIDLLSKMGEDCIVLGETTNDGGHQVEIKPLGLVCDGHRKQRVFRKYGRVV
jgi:phosphoribosylformylglycinamidine cyclo-ligase